MSVTDLPDYTGYSDVENVYGDVKIYTPSGLWVVGSDIITARAVSGTLLIGGGEEDEIFATDPTVSTRGRIRTVGLGLYDCVADAFNDAILRIYLDDDVDAGTPTIEILVWDIDLLNGREIGIRSRHGLYDTTITIDSTTYEVYYAKQINSQHGAVVYALRDSTATTEFGWRDASAWVVLNCEWLEKVRITLYNDNASSANTLYGHGVVLYGLYP